MKKYLAFLFSVLLILLLPIGAYAADDDPQQYTITIKYVFHSGYIEDTNIIYQFDGETITCSPGDDIFVPTVGINNFHYHIDGYPDEMTWNLGEKVVLGGGNPDPLEDDDWANFHTPSMIAEDVDIIFHYVPHTDMCLLQHYFEQQDGSYTLQKTQKTNLGIYDVYEYEYDLSKYHLNVENYTFDESNENNILIGYPVFRTVDESPFIFKYYYNLIEKETEPETEPTTEEPTSPTPTEPSKETEPTTSEKPTTPTEPTTPAPTEPETTKTPTPIVPTEPTTPTPTESTTVPPAPTEPTTVAPTTIPTTTTVATTTTEETTTKKEISTEEIKKQDAPLTIIETPERHWALLNLLLTAGSILISIILGFLFLFNKKNNKDFNNFTYNFTYNEEKQYRRNIVKRFISIIISAIMMFIFAITEDINLPMKFTDKYTPLMIIIFIVHLLMAVIWRQWIEKDDEFEDEGEN